MLDLRECIAFCDIPETEIEAISDHQNIPILSAAMLGHLLRQTPHGQAAIRDIIFDDIRHALDSGRADKAFRYAAACKVFISQAAPDALALPRNRRSAADTAARTSGTNNSHQLISALAAEAASKARAAAHDGNGTALPAFHSSASQAHLSAA